MPCRHDASVRTTVFTLGSNGCSIVGEVRAFLVFRSPGFVPVAIAMVFLSVEDDVDGWSGTPSPRQRRQYVRPDLGTTIVP